MSESNVKSLFNNTAMLYMQTESSRYDVCLDQRSFKCKIGDNFISIGAKSLILSSPVPPWKMNFITILLCMGLSCLESHILPSFLRPNIHNRSVKYVTI